MIKYVPVLYILSLKCYMDETLFINYKFGSRKKIFILLQPNTMKQINKSFTEKIFIEI